MKEIKKQNHSSQTGYHELICTCISVTSACKNTWVPCTAMCTQEKVCGKNKAGKLSGTRNPACPLSQTGLWQHHCCWYSRFSNRVHWSHPCCLQTLPWRLHSLLSHNQPAGLGKQWDRILQRCGSPSFGHASWIRSHTLWISRWLHAISRVSSHWWHMGGQVKEAGRWSLDIRIFRAVQKWMQCQGLCHTEMNV